MNMQSVSIAAWLTLCLGILSSCGSVDKRDEGGRTFSLEKSSQAFPPARSFQPGLADVDNDGDLDAVLPNMGHDFSQVMLNDGKACLWIPDKN